MKKNQPKSDYVPRYGRILIISGFLSLGLVAIGLLFYDFFVNNIRHEGVTKLIFCTLAFAGFGELFLGYKFIRKGRESRH